MGDFGQLEEQHGKDGLCEALCSTPGYDRLLVELACTASSSASARTEAEAAETVGAVALLLSATLVRSFATESGRAAWQATLFSLDEECR